jgi:glutaminase
MQSSSLHSRSAARPQFDAPAQTTPSAATQGALPACGAKKSQPSVFSGLINLAHKVTASATAATTGSQAAGAARNNIAPKAPEPVKVISTAVLQEIIDVRKTPPGKGRFVAGIPGTAPDWEQRALTVLNLKTGECITAGKLVPYSQQSMSKPIAESLAIEMVGLKKFKTMVGFEASGRPYNANVTFPDRPGVPYNGNVNIGALKVWDVIVANTPPGIAPIDHYLEYERKLSGNPNLKFNAEMAEGEFSFEPSPGEPNNNRKLLQELKRHGNLQSDPEAVLKAYCQACAVMVNTEDMARIRAKFNDGSDPATGEQLIPREIAQHTARSMGVSGLYDESGLGTVEYGALIKSGVDGGLMGNLPSKVPGQPDLIFATHHAGLNPRGNSEEGLKWVKSLSRMSLVFPGDQTSSSGRSVKAALRSVRGQFGKATVAGSAKKPGAALPLALSPQALNEKLLGEMTPPAQHALKEAIEALMKKDSRDAGAKGKTYNKKGFYLKEAKDDLSLWGAQHLLSAVDTNGVEKNYFRVADRHFLEKIVVTSAPRRGALGEFGAKPSVVK